MNLGEVHNTNENFNNYSELIPILKGVEIVMLGEQSHGEATTYETKIKLIKYLHQELDFDLLVFESGFYDCSKAWQKIKEGENVRDAIGKSIFSIWSATKNLIPLSDYIEKVKNSDKPLKLLGFDSQLTGKYSENYFIRDLSDYLRETKPSILETKEWEHFSENIRLLTTFDFKEFKKNKPQQCLNFLLKLVSEIKETKENHKSEFWTQTLKSTHSYLSDVSLKTDFRDKQMAENLIWIREKYPDSKIICWGATSHFLYNSEIVRMKSPFIQLSGGNYYKKQPMMGGYIKSKFQDKVYTIGFTAYKGEYGLFSRGKIKIPKEGTLEFMLGKSKYDNFLLPLYNLNLDGYKSRPLGNFYMKNDIDEVMDAVIFNREMKRPRLDRNFFIKIYPENKYIKPETE
ncbi:MAG: erythromycin esterase family protein [Flavobacteriaceae bacterium]|nr:erythromycin esterase family protein [Flavobacteriaceae bacterium]